MDPLKQQLLLGQFIQLTGASEQEARKLLVEARWEFETALSLFFDESSVVSQQQPSGGNCQPIAQLRQARNLVPTNTPATPPNFPEALLALSRMSTTNSQQQQPSSSWSSTMAGEGGGGQSSGGSGGGGGHPQQ